jgi:hypothetical protein
MSGFKIHICCLLAVATCVIGFLVVYHLWPVILTVLLIAVVVYAIYRHIENQTQNKGP